MLTRRPWGPDPEVVAKPARRRFSAKYRLRILKEADRCTQPGEIGRLLRREGLYNSHLSVWRKARRNGSLKALTPKKRGAKPAESNPLSGKVRQLEAKVARLEKELATAQLLADLGVTRSLGRPQVSDDNPFSEAQFKTLKYHPGFPGRFDDINAAVAVGEVLRSIRLSSVSCRCSVYMTSKEHQRRPLLLRRRKFLKPQ